MISNSDRKSAMHIRLDDRLPEPATFEPGIRRAPMRELTLHEEEIKLALQNALRYIPEEHHKTLAPEFLAELTEHGRIYGYRYRPKGKLCGKPIDQYKGKCLAGKAFQVMIDNNLDFDIALYPYELVTYGETGQVCQNWMQYQLIMRYLQEITEEQTLVIHSGHPLGLFRSHPGAPRVITANALMVGMFDDQENWHRAAALGVANYGQMTAGGWMYIGPQGIVHGTYNTLSIAGRLKLGLAHDQDLSGKLFVSSGLGGMSGAQGKAVRIANGVGIIAELDPSRVKTRFDQGWVDVVATSPKEAFLLARKAQQERRGQAIAFQGNIIDLLEYAVNENEPIDLLSDQTSCHAVYDGGYCPVELSFEERTALLASDTSQFRKLVDSSLHRHYEAIRTLTEQGTYFFDYGNSFLKAVYDAGIKEISKNGRDDKDGFIWPSYVEDILGPELFDYGYGPFRWVCLSGKEEDLDSTDQVAAECIKSVRETPRYQDIDNYRWIVDAKKNKLVVGTKARILYQDAKGRTEIALRFNKLVRDREVGPIMLGRDHHDTGGTDSPFRETSNIKDGSNIMADMSTTLYAGNAARGMSLVALHNGGGVGIGKSINGGFGMVLDGSERVDAILRTAMPWDVMGGVARRAWARNPHAVDAALAYNSSSDHITLPYEVAPSLIDSIVEAHGKP
ncbi:MAG: urocanate hydratase [Bdellovibrionales bacterium]|nr:urocanate hydratase [Bdellovibrionales bacterium]